MAWQSWVGRTGQLPVVLAGPVLRRVEPRSVTVWLALKEEHSVTLRAFGSSPTDASAFVGTADTVKIAEKLHVVAVTASHPTDSLVEGKLYQYNVYLGPKGGGPAPVSANNLSTSGILQNGTIGPANVGYGGAGLPSFALPPADLNRLRIVHGSCRKPHGGGRDGLAGLDTLIATSVADPLKRPHLFFMTGDQIYADDVADGLLTMLMDAVVALEFRAETLPVFGQAPRAGGRESKLDAAGTNERPRRKPARSAKAPRNESSQRTSPAVASTRRAAHKRVLETALLHSRAAPSAATQPER